MSTIRVDPNMLRKAAHDIAAIGEDLRAAGSRLHQSTQGAPGYDGQFGSRVASVGLEALARLRMLADRIAERSAWLAARAEAFEAADVAALQGLATIRQELLAWVHSQEGLPLDLTFLEGVAAGTSLAELEALITRPPWLVARERPPHIPAEAWAHMNLAERSATFAETQASLRRFWGIYRDRMTGGEIPELWVVAALGMNVRVQPNVKADKVRNGLENRDTVAWDGQPRWGEDGRLWYHVSYNVGKETMDGWVAAWEWGKRGGETNLAPVLPAEEGGGFAPAAETRGYGEGRSGWADYYSEPLPSQPQFLNVREILRMAGFEDWEKFPLVHHNLCGELAVFEAVGVPLEEGFRAFVEIPDAGEKTPSGYDVLRNDDVTSSYHLEHTFAALGFTPATKSLSLSDPIPELRGIVLHNHRAAIVNVAIDDAGNLLPAVSKDRIEHWVHVTNIRTVVTEDGAETTWVDYYNPYTNSTQTSSDTVLTQSFLGTVVTAERGG